MYYLQRLNIPTHTDLTYIFNNYYNIMRIWRVQSLVMVVTFGIVYYNMIGSDFKTGSTWAALANIGLRCRTAFGCVAKIGWTQNRTDRTRSPSTC